MKLNDTKLNYLTTEKEMLAVAFASENFCSYLVGSKMIVLIDLVVLKYLLIMKYLKARLIP